VHNTSSILPLMWRHTATSRERWLGAALPVLIVHQHYCTCLPLLYTLHSFTPCNTLWFLFLLLAMYKINQLNCLEWWGTGVVMVQLMLLPPRYLLLQWNPEWFTFLVPAYPGFLERKPLNGYSSSTGSSSNSLGMVCLNQALRLICIIQQCSKHRQSYCFTY